MYKILLFSSIFITSCTIFLPEIYVATERTAAEKQLIGEFSKDDELGQKNKDFYLFIKSYNIDSLSNIKQDDTLNFYLDKKILIADEIYELKNSGIIGENNDGLIEIIDKKSTPNKRVSKVVNIENNIRNYIIKQYVKQNNITINEASKNMYQYNMYILLENQYYQTREGKWIKKI